MPNIVRESVRKFRDHGSSMAQDDIDNDRLLGIIGVTPAKPAQFVILCIAQWVGESAVAE